MGPVISIGGIKACAKASNLKTSIRVETRKLKNNERVSYCGCGWFYIVPAQLGCRFQWKNYRYCARNLGNPGFSRKCGVVALFLMSLMWIGRVYFTVSVILCLIISGWPLLV